MKQLDCRLLVLLFCVLSRLPLPAQPLRTYPAGDLKLALKKLNVVGTALYMAAHPDDENTAMLAYLAKDRLVRAAYLSVTRGDGGQNLIGSEQAELLGLIRTHELLQARRHDGAEQYFTRANDFGFSKTTEEALKVWEHEKVLADAVWTIRNLRPDVIITRFPPDSRAGHGHHSASAVLAEEAYAAAADPKRFPEQLKFVQPWQVKRVVWNAYNPGFTNTPPEGPNVLPVQIGGYSPLLGKSYTEIAGESRSMHKSQGFGSGRARGLRTDYLKHTVGEPARNDLFDDVDLTWKRVKGAEALSMTLQEAYNGFNPENPAASLPLLLQAYAQMEKLGADPYVKVKKGELTDLIVACAGLWYEINAAGYAATPGSTVKTFANVVKRSDFPVQLDDIKVLNTAKDTTIRLELKNNDLLNLPVTVSLPAALEVTQPYWLVNPPSKGMYRVDDLQLIGKPEKEPQLTAEFRFRIGGVPFTLRSPVQYKWVDQVAGELYRPFEVRPAVMVNMTEKVYMFPTGEGKDVPVLLKAGKDDARGEVSLQLPKGWKAEPASVPFTLAKAEEEKRVLFKVTPPNNASEAVIKAVVKTADGNLLTRGIVTIDHAHIPRQTLFPAAEVRAVRLDVKTGGKNIAYLMGAGDEVPAALRQIGYSVTMLEEEDLKGEPVLLEKFDAIVLGVRAFNTRNSLRFYNQTLFKYAENGGVVVVQYTVSRPLVTEQLGPYPFELSRDRVTVEEAPVTFREPGHQVFNRPNQITPKDFEGWVQERGLYFAQKWDAKYLALLSSTDPGEKPQDGGLLVAPHGQGKFVYTGYAFFRQLPAGVPGAYRLFANLLAK
jgi:LmbE family N-acetylglucosaminyl deacetylase